MSRAAVSFIIGLVITASTSDIIPRSSLAAPLDGIDSSVETLPSGNSETPTRAASSSAIQAARQAFVNKDLTRCLELLTVAKAQDPSLPPPRLVLADLYFQANLRAAGRATLERVAVEDPGHPELFRLFGSVALTEQRWTEAIMHFDHALELTAPSSWSAQQKTTFVISTKKGLAVAAERRGDLKMAAHLTGEIAELSPHDSQLRDRWASLLFQADMKDKAYEQFKISYLRDDRMSPPELSMGIMYVNQGEPATADQWFARAAKAHPTNSTVHFQIAVALMVQDRATESAQHSAKAAQLGLDSADLNMVRGYAARQLRVYDAAEILFRKVVAQRPDDIAAMNQLALVLIEQDDPEKQKDALQIATKVLQRRENSANAQATHAWVTYRMGKVSEAEELFREAVATPGIGPEALYLAGRAFADQGNASDAANVADKLATTISAQGIYVLRPVARKWLENQQEITP